MTSKQDFTEDEWVRVRRAPLVAGLAISMADPGGPIELAKETMASLRTAATPPSQEDLLAAVSDDLKAATEQKQNLMEGFKVDSAALAGKQVLDELRAVDAIVASKATPEEAAAFRRWLLDAAKAAADAAKEGGFMGFGAEQVSRGEETMLQHLRSALAGA
jgi:hypothetical protein